MDRDVLPLVVYLGAVSYTHLDVYKRQPLKNVYQTFGVTVRQFTKRFQCTPENLRKKVNPSIGLGLGHLKLNSMEFLKGIGLQIYQYEEHFVLNQRQHCCKIYVGALYLPR